MINFTIDTLCQHCGDPQVLPPETCLVFLVFVRVRSSSPASMPYHDNLVARLGSCLLHDLG